MYRLDLKITEIAKTIGDEWNNLDQNQKSVNYNKIFLNDLLDLSKQSGKTQEEPRN